jgi:exo-1,4-beta-D-glucosaminidase
MAVRTRTTKHLPNWVRLFVICAWLAASLGPTRAAASSPLSEIPLKSGWMVQSDCKVHGAGAELSMPSARTDGWYTASIPATVLAVQVAAGEFKDPFVGTNLRSIPGTSYPLGENFSNLELFTLPHHLSRVLEDCI